MAKRKEKNILLNELTNTDVTPRKILNLFLEMIGNYDNKSWEHIEKREFDKAIQVTDEMNKLGLIEFYLLLLAKEELLSRDDSETYKYMEPHIRSVQKLIEDIDAWKAGSNKMPCEDSEEVTAYEERKMNDAWQEDEEKSVPVIKIKKRELLDHFCADKTADDIPRGTFTNRDTGIEVIFGRRTIEEIMNKTMENNKNSIIAEVKTALLYQIQELIENTICFDHLDSGDHPAGKNKSDSALIHRLYGMIEYSGSYCLAKFKVDMLCDDVGLAKIFEPLGKLYRISDINIIPAEEPFN